MSNKYLIVILRFHGDVLLTKPMLDNIKLNDPDCEIDLLVYKGTGSILEQEDSVSEIIEIDASSKENIYKKVKKEIRLWKKINTKKYDYAFFLTTQWRVIPISWSIGKAMKAAVDDKKRRKNLWIKSFSVIFPEALEKHIIQRNLVALESLGLKIFNEKLTLDLRHLDTEYKTLSDNLQRFYLRHNKTSSANDMEKVFKNQEYINSMKTDKYKRLLIKELRSMINLSN